MSYDNKFLSANNRDYLNKKSPVRYYQSHATRDNGLKISSYRDRSDEYRKSRVRSSNRNGDYNSYHNSDYNDYHNSDYHKSKDYYKYNCNARVLHYDRDNENSRYPENYRSRGRSRSNEKKLTDRYDSQEHRSSKPKYCPSLSNLKHESAILTSKSTEISNILKEKNYLQNDKVNYKDIAFIEESLLCKTKNDHFDCQINNEIVLNNDNMLLNDIIQSDPIRSCDNLTTLDNYSVNCPDNLTLETLKMYENRENNFSLFDYTINTTNYSNLDDRFNHLSDKALKENYVTQLRAYSHLLTNEIKET